jgi:hypothetical protein
MFGSIEFLRPSKIRCYFITGTGRCGTMLVSKLLSIGKNTHCDHENSICYRKMTPAYLTGNMGSLYEEIETIIEPLVKSHNRRGLSYGESSGLMYLAFKKLYRRYGKKARFILLTRHPEGFVESALARGFFDPTHPYALEHLRARPATEIGQRWETTSPFEKCFWYWNLVNSMIYDFFCTLPNELWKVQPIEKLDVTACQELYNFLQIEGFDEKAVKKLLSKRINATPGKGNNEHVNPMSKIISIGERSTWNVSQQLAYSRWAQPLMQILYPYD